MTDSRGAVDFTGLEEEERSDAEARSRKGMVLGFGGSNGVLEVNLFKAILARLMEDR